MDRTNQGEIPLPSEQLPPVQPGDARERPAGRRAGRTRFGEVLLRYLIISEAQLQQALEQQKRNGLLLGRIIAEEGYAKAEQIVHAINRHFHIAAGSLSDDIAGMIQRRPTGLARLLAWVRFPISAKIAIAMIVVIASAILILSNAILEREAKQLYEATVSQGRLSLRYFESSARIPILRDDTVSLNKLIQEAAQQKGLAYAIVVDREGTIQAHTDLAHVGRQLPEFRNRHNLTRQDGLTYFDYTDPAGRRVLDLSSPVTFQSTELGRIHVGVSLDFIERQIARAKFVILALSVAFAVLGVVVSVGLGVLLSRRISRLAAATREIGQGNFRHRVHMIMNDEIGDLAKSFNRMAHDLEQKRTMQRSFGQYLSPDIVEMILQNPESSWLKGRRSEATVIFTDIRGFTAYSETRQPEEIVKALNEYFEIATKWILQYGGYVDKFIGDAVMGVFGVPVPWPDHATRAVRACMAMEKELQERGRVGNEIAGKVGVGINSGTVISGNIGSQVKTEYTVIGDDVNLASRLNGLAGDGQVIISESTYGLTRHLLRVVPLEAQRVKGKSQAVKAYRVLWVL